MLPNYRPSIRIFLFSKRFSRERATILKSGDLPLHPLKRFRQNHPQTWRMCFAKPVIAQYKPSRRTNDVKKSGSFPLSSFQTLLRNTALKA